ncbi:uncharacterized protein Bfra_008696 [Botrytis fragariae]|uniref:Uncharacterized protein n=1 Tax=Botrytis fragariae TaxID=1964551 RepID=A0A8H6APR8_9HELO|nr:uncharacterized protein Bfra_008696 [Botrytis fragariae]KAF5871673.1 hypothetical protein Bfra_008696 [Botrytis fragariae]
MRKRGNIKAAVWEAKDDEGNDDLLPTNWVWGPGRSIYERFFRKAMYGMFESKDGNNSNGAKWDLLPNLHSNGIFCTFQYAVLGFASVAYIQQSTLH